MLWIILGAIVVVGCFMLWAICKVGSDYDDQIEAENPLPSDIEKTDKKDVIRISADEIISIWYGY